MNELTPVLQEAADSFLRSDHAKNHAFGGQRLNNVVKVVVNEDLPMLTVYAEDGSSQEVAILPGSVYRPKDRAIKPADVLDAVGRAMHDAAQALSDNNILE